MTDITYDILEDHQSRNRRPHKPIPARLRRSAAQHTSPECEASDHEDDMHEDSDNNVDASDSSPEPESKRARRYSMTAYRSNRGNPTQLQFYKGNWVTTLEARKKCFQLYVSTECAFPDRENNLRNATECLQYVIREHTDDGGEFKIG